MQADDMHHEQEHQLNTVEHPINRQICIMQIYQIYMKYDIIRYVLIFKRNIKMISWFYSTTNHFLGVLTAEDFVKLFYLLRESDCIYNISLFFL